ncbi:MAG: translation initiation factor, partial [Actinomycetota bacterium]
MRVHELAKELGMTNTELLDLCKTMGVEAKNQSSSVIEAQADRLRRRAERDGLTRPEQPEEVKPAKKGAAKKAAPKKDAEPTGAEPVVEPTERATSADEVVATLASAPTAAPEREAESVAAPVLESAADRAAESVGVPESAAPAAPPASPAPSVASAPVSSAAPVTSAPPVTAPPVTSTPPVTSVAEGDEPRKIISTRPGPGDAGRPSSVAARP